MSLFLGNDGVEGVFLGDINSINTASFINGEPLAGEVQLLPYDEGSEGRQLFVGNSQEIRLVNLVGTNSGAEIKDASVMISIEDRSQRQVEGVEWPLNLTQINETNSYVAFIPSSINVLPKGAYFLTVTATKDSSRGEWVESAISEDRLPDQKINLVSTI